MMSMVKYFFDISHQQLARQLFADSLLAKQHPRFYEETCGQYPIIFVSFAGCTDITWQDMKWTISNIMLKAYQSHRYLLNDESMYEEDREYFLDILKHTAVVSYNESLARLIAMLERKWEKRVIVIVDEYEKPLSVAFENSFLGDAVGFLSGSLTTCLKDNPYVVTHLHFDAYLL